VPNYANSASPESAADPVEIVPIQFDEDTAPSISGSISLTGQPAAIVISSKTTRIDQFFSNLPLTFPFKYSPVFQQFFQKNSLTSIGHVNGVI
jgi:hypothetical protein